MNKTLEVVAKVMFKKSNRLEKKKKNLQSSILIPLLANHIPRIVTNSLFQNLQITELQLRLHGRVHDHSFAAVVLS